MGIAMAIPSGMLWSMIARPYLIPILISIVDDKKVSTPSGILWMISANMFKMPSLYKLSWDFFWIFLSITEFTLLPIRIINSKIIIAIIRL